MEYNKKKIFWLACLVIFIYLLFSLGKTSNTITAKNQIWWQKIGGLWGSAISNSQTKEEQELLDKNFPLPKEETDRWDVLILGIRGVDDPDGGLLTDTIMLFSLDKKTNRASLTSIPRDIYVDLPGVSKGKINEIYERGVIRRKAIAFSKENFSRLTGVYIDNIIVFNFKAFEEIIDTLGGIEVNLKKPFEEKSQWGYEFSLPAGLNHLNGPDALYFVRSRYSTSDFDRSLRQQQVILAIKDKAFRVGILGNPLKLTSILKTLNKNIVTDLNIFDTSNIIKLANSFDSAKHQPALKHLSTDNLLDQTFQDELYILKPKKDDWNLFRDYFKNLP